MIKSGDRLICTKGNDLYTEGRFYTVGEFVNDKYFQLLTGCNGELWYASINDKGICVPFNIMESGYGDAWFAEINHAVNDNQDSRTMNNNAAL